MSATAHAHVDDHAHDDHGHHHHIGTVVSKRPNLIDAAHYHHPISEEWRK